MQLIGQYDSPYVRRIAVTLHLQGLPFTRNPLSVFADAEAMRRINPLGRVPSVVLDDGEVLIDSAAILDHLDEVVGPARALVPREGAERRRVLQIVALATGTMDKAIAISVEQLLRPAVKQHPEWLDRCRLQLATGLAALESTPCTPWLTGERMTHADIATACLIGYLRLRVPDAFAASRFPVLEQLSAACEARPEFVAARPSATDTMPGPA